MKPPFRTRVAGAVARVLTGTLAVAGVLAVTIVVVGPATPARAAPLQSTPLITYNMQGATAGNDSKWVTTVRGYIRAAEIVALQEAGPTPPGTFQNSTTIGGLPQVGRAGFIQHSRWATNTGSFEVYFLQTDPNGGGYVGGRNNLAIVTHREADEITAVPNPVPNGRPALGVRFGNDWYFTAHALSNDNRPNDSAALSGAVAAFVHNRGRGEQWTIAGDWNLQPGQWNPPQGSTTYASGQATHQNGRELDYGIASVRIPGHRVVREPGASSDHYAVAIGNTRAGAEPQRLFSTPRTLENMQDGAVVETYLQHTENGTPVTAYRRTGSSTQEWNLEFFSNGNFRLRLGNGRCAIPAARSDAFRPMLQDCDSLDVQQWRLEDVGGDQWQIRSVVVNQCMDVGGSQQPVAVDLHLQPCDATRAAQHWLLSPADVPDPDDQGPGPGDLAVAFPDGGVENAATKQLLNHDQHSFAYPVTTTPHRSDRAADQQFDFDWLGDGSTLQIRDPGNGECLAEEDANGLPDDFASLRPCNRSDVLQQWRPEPTGENEFYLVGNVPGNPLCLETEPNRVPDESIPQIIDCRAGYPTMRWYFAPTGITRLDPS